MMPIICHRQTAASTAPMPDARAWRRGQVPQPRSGAPKAQDLTAAITVAAPSHVPSIAPDDVMAPDSTGADAPMNAFITPRIYTSLTDVTCRPAVTCPQRTCATAAIRRAQVSRGRS